MDTVDAERKRAKDHGSFAEESYRGELMVFALRFWEGWESSSSCRWCHVETELTVLRQEANPPAGSCVLTETCYSLRSLLKAFYLERTSARRGWVLSKTLTTRLGVGLLACVHEPMNRQFYGGLVRGGSMANCCFRRLVIIGMWLRQACGSGIIGWWEKTLGGGTRLEVVSR
jgi:hypothetical protein